MYLKSTDTGSNYPKVSIGKIIYDILYDEDLDETILYVGATGKNITQKHFLEASVTLANNLSRLGIGKNDIVAIIAPNSWEYLALTVASFYIGATVFLLNFSYTSGELSKLFESCNPNIIFCTNEILSTILKIKTEATIITIDNNQSNNIKSVPELLITLDNYKNFTPVDVNVDEDVAFIITSSGTTGFPKAVMIPHVSTLTLCESSGVGERSLVPFMPQSTTINYLPFFHIMGLSWCILSLVSKTKAVIMDKFQPEIFLQLLEKYKMEIFFAVPPVVSFLTKSPLVSKYDLSSIKIIMCSSAPVDSSVEERFKSTLPNAKFMQLYGMSEMGGPIAVARNAIKKGSVGKPTYSNVVKICDENGVVLGVNQVGEFRVKGRGIMKGYYNNLEATSATFDEEGFLMTGDLGYFDKDGDMFIVGRSKEVIKYKGFQVPPAELEDILNSHSEIEESGVIGIPDERAGELPLAFVVKTKNSSITKEEVVKYVDDNVSVQKRLYGGVRFIEAIPRNTNGKILRTKLKELFENEKNV